MRNHTIYVISNEHANLLRKFFREKFELWRVVLKNSLISSADLEKGITMDSVAKLRVGRQFKVCAYPLIFNISLTFQKHLIIKDWIPTRYLNKWELYFCKDSFTSVKEYNKNHSQNTST